MALQIVSDLHLEIHDDYDTYTITPRAPVFALLGDIGLVEAHRVPLARFLARHLRQFQAVLLVPGNHEAYHSTWPRTRQILQSFEDEVHTRRTAGNETSLGELVVLDRQAYRLPGLPGQPGTVVLGCSLFSHVPPQHAVAVGQGMNDYRLTTGGWDVAAHNAAHARDLAWLNEVVTSLGSTENDISNIIIVTHWSPTTDRRARDPRHGDASGDALASSFATDLSAEACFRSPKVKVWAFGHTHYNCDFFIPRSGDAVVTGAPPPLRLVTNQRGYSAAHAAGYDSNKALTI